MNILSSLTVKEVMGNCIPKNHHEVTSLNKILCMFLMDHDDGSRTGRGLERDSMISLGPFRFKIVFCI